MTERKNDERRRVEGEVGPGPDRAELRSPAEAAAWSRVRDHVLHDVGEDDMVGPDQVAASSQTGGARGTADAVSAELTRLREAIEGPMADLAARLESIEGELDRRVGKEIARHGEETTEWLGSRVEDAERRLELQAVAIDEALAGERRRIDSALEKLSKLRRSAKRGLRGSGELEAKLRAGTEKAAKRAAGKALEERIAAEQQGLVKQVRKAAKETQGRLADRARELAVGLEATASEAQNRLEAAVAEAERSGALLDKRIGNATKQIEAAARADGEKVLAKVPADAKLELQTAFAETARREAAASANECAGELVEQLLDKVREAERSARRSIAADAEAGAERLVASEQAQEREERVRAAASDAERDSEQRVREAERRLLDVLAQIGEVEEQLEREGSDSVSG